MCYAKKYEISAEDTVVNLFSKNYCVFWLTYK